MLAGFWEHINELKHRLKIIFIALIAATAFFALFPSNPAHMFTAKFWLTGLYSPIVSVFLNWIRNFIAPRGLQIISLEIGAPFEIYFLASIIFGFLVSSPVIAYELYRFVDPALYPHERKSVYPFRCGIHWPIHCWSTVWAIYFVAVHSLYSDFVFTNCRLVASSLSLRFLLYDSHHNSFDGIRLYYPRSFRSVSEVWHGKNKHNRKKQSLVLLHFIHSHGDYYT